MNAFLNGGNVRELAVLVSWVGDYLYEFQCSYLALNPRCSHAFPTKNEVWLPLPTRFLKLNYDVSVHSGTPFIGVGTVIRDSNGWVMAADSKRIGGNFFADIGEFLALRKGLFLAKRHNLSVQLDEVDASALHSSSSDLGDASLIINDIRALFEEVGVLNCQAIPRSSNCLAHNLAFGLLLR
ncbi:hypothetical protein LWI28_023119 [Acer negundo]|uniref:RNase H type-1 domain-containing protein n=1 Tax=Acer negundo TaxID=4023 RepID=A0AAD5I813_ACENE|nr:hypothetical protein LWI28_023119 [Acer negundo]